LISRETNDLGWRSRLTALPRRFASASDALAALSASGPATDIATGATQIATQIEATLPPREGALAVARLCAIAPRTT
jgi:lysophospholipase L1-like esterase